MTKAFIFGASAAAFAWFGYVLGYGVATINAGLAR